MQVALNSTYVIKFSCVSAIYQPKRELDLGLSYIGNSKLMNTFDLNHSVPHFPSVGCG